MDGLLLLIVLLGRELRRPQGDPPRPAAARVQRGAAVVRVGGLPRADRREHVPPTSVAADARAHRRDHAGRRESLAVFRTASRITTRDWLVLAVLGVIGHFLYQAFFVEGLAAPTSPTPR